MVDQRSWVHVSDARMAVISAGTADDPRVGWVGNKKVHSDYLRVGRGRINKSLMMQILTTYSKFATEI